MTHAAGYGYWIASDRGKLGGGHPFKTKINNINLAEMMAICNTIHIAMKIGYVETGELILVQTDSLSAIGAFTKRRKVTREDEMAVVRFFETFDSQLSIEFRHVKAHNADPGRRFQANNSCDRQAKAAMRIARNIIQKG